MIDRATALNPLLKREVQISSPTAPVPIPFVISKRYHNLIYIADGSYGVVVSATDALSQHTHNPSSVAIKRCHKAFSSATDAKHLLREIRLLRALSHENIVQLRDVDLPPSYAAWDDVYLVTPLMPSGSLSQRLAHFARERPGEPLPDIAIKTVLVGLARALLYMHSGCVVHRDLKTANVLVKEDWTPVLCDLGLARAFEGDEHDLTTGVVTKSYRAPELFLTPSAYSDRMDMWSLGCILAELIRPGEPLFRRTRSMTELGAILDVLGTPTESDMEKLFPNSDHRSYLQWQLEKRVREKVPMKVWFEDIDVEDERVFDVLERLLKLDPGQRMSPQDMLSCDYLKEVRDEEKEVRIGEERRREILEMEPPSKCSKSYIKRALWAEVANHHPQEAVKMESRGYGPEKIFGRRKISSKRLTGRLFGALKKSDSTGGLTAHTYD